MKEYVTELTFISEKLRKYDAIIAKRYLLIINSYNKDKLRLIVKAFQNKANLLY